ncbi:putative pentatricopeptide repeat-containing protein At1g56570 [Amaranthus tricolor]|uniref:putative pentatricopeptide repeat-containing protein At1g56570 n=1 Tax=Amaranthus tricolor TaxID=29722 RepID=UPI00258F0FDF|nr:putative pentatricopeptide repeat-containing protein At1g56570 [Amaranthus tricolor]
MNAIKQSSSYIRPIPSTVLRALQWTQPNPPYSHKTPSILATNLIKSYFDKGSFKEARQLFDQMPDRDVVAWTAMIAGYTSCNVESLAWSIFYEMLKEGITPNGYTVSSLLKACKRIKSYTYGALVHGLAIKHGLVGSIYVDNSLMDLYATCCSTMKEACMVFRDINPKNGVSWTTLIAGYTHRGDGYSGLRVFQQMLFENPEQSAFSLSITVKACALTGESSHGAQLHATIVKYGLNSSLPIMNSVLDMYCRCQCLSEASQCFNEILQKDLITWNTLIVGYKRSNPSKCLSVFSSMATQGVTPNNFTFTSVIAACADLSLLTCGQQIHADILRRGLDRNVALTNSLIDMYAKCGNASDSRKVFELLSSKDLVSWTSMMMAYGVHGYGKEAVGLFNEMLKSDIQPDRLAFMAVLRACSHAGLVNEGLRYFNSMVNEYNITPDQDIYSCIVDLLGRAGKVEAAYELIHNMPENPSDSVWGALLGSFKAHKLPILGKLASQFILEARPDMARTYLMLSKLYASEGDWKDFAKMRKLMKGLGSRKEPGCSWIELKNDVTSFVVGDKAGLHIDKVYEVLSMMVLHMEVAGHAPDTDGAYFT